MGMIALKCPQCSADINLDDSRDFGFCSYCGTKIQLNETIVFHHKIEINVNEQKTIDSLVKRGLMEIELGELSNASKTFDQAMNLSPEAESVLVPVMYLNFCEKNEGWNHDSWLFYNKRCKFYYGKLVAKHPAITEEEKRLISPSTSQRFARMYLMLHDSNRFDYVIHSCEELDVQCFSWYIKQPFCDVAFLNSCINGLADYNPSVFLKYLEYIINLKNLSTWSDWPSIITPYVLQVLLKNKLLSVVQIKTVINRIRLTHLTKLEYAEYEKAFQSVGITIPRQRINYVVRK